MSTLSLHLSRVLDGIGLNELTVQKRREVCLYREQELAVYEKLFHHRKLPFIFGSQIEGTTTPGLYSDLDYLICDPMCKIIQSLGEWVPGKPNLMMLRERTAPGYCRLQLLNIDKPVPEDDLRYYRVTHDELNRVMLMNSPDPLLVTSGPAQTICMPHLDSDKTNAFICTSRLQETEKWAIRKRNNGWPTASLINQVVNDPFFLVPVGYKLSPTESLEWRISTSLAERRLMFSLNMVQIKCYVILKILIKTFVTPEVGRIISSYHCKTALLYCIESTKADFWRENNLLQSIIRCLEMLHAWVSDECCPHFILAGVNLFAGNLLLKQRRVTLQSFIRCLIQNITHVLLDVDMDGLGHRLYMKLDTKPERLPILDSFVTKMILGFLELRRNIHVDIPFLLHVSSWKPSTVIFNVQQTKSILESSTTFSNKFQQEATERAIRFLSSCLGSMLASSSLARHGRIPQQAIDLLDASTAYDVSFLLKQASVFFCGGHVEKVEHLCKNICDHLKQKLTYPVCTCVSVSDRYSSEQIQTMHTSKNDVQYAQCVAFTPHEINCVPPALRYELFRATGDDIHQRNFQDDWMFLAVVDCLLLLYYLQFMTYRNLGQYDLSKECIHDLELCIREENQLLVHVETAWNILGQCHEMEKHPVAALHCYITSLAIRPRNNAAIWLLPLLLYSNCHTGVEDRPCNPLVSPQIRQKSRFDKGTRGCEEEEKIPFVGKIVDKDNVDEDLHMTFSKTSKCIFEFRWPRNDDSSNGCGRYKVFIDPVPYGISGRQ